VKRFLYIVTGAIGSLAAILSITPPQFGGASTGATSALGGAKSSTSSAAASNAAAATTATPAAAASTPAASSPAPVATTKATTKKKKKTTKKTTTKATTSGGTTTSTTTTTTTPATTAPAPAASTPAASSGVSGTFTGAAYDAAEPNGRVWGSVSVTIVLKNGKVVSSTGSQSPSSRGPYAFSALDPFFASNQMTLQEIKAMTTSSVISKTLYVGGVTYSSLAYWSSVKSALAKAGI